MEQIRLINLEDEKPTVKQAMDRLELELRLAKKQNVCVLKIIHGFGSTGNGGKIRVALRRAMPEYQKRGKIRFFVPGERLTIFEEETRKLLQRVRISEKITTSIGTTTALPLLCCETGKDEMYAESKQGTENRSHRTYA